MAQQRLALGFSGGGDSTALLLALRASLPGAELHAFIVDHGLRPESAQDAEAAARFAQQAGARARIVRWDAPRAGQARAREARHRLLAAAARSAGARLLCLGHTLDDRLETLRMRAARPGGEIRMAGPSPFDPSPAWPEGEALILARPFLELSRASLRDYLRGQGATWIEDPSNTDAAYERVRLRSTPIDRDAAASLLRRSDAARAERDRLQSEAFNLIDAASTLLAWGGMRLDAGRLAAAEPEVALKALERLVLAASGRPAPPRPAQLGAVLKALAAGRAVSVGGAHLTACGVLGRDAGVAGRADGVAAAPALRLGPGQSGVFDGRWRVRADRPVRIEVLGERAGSLSGDVPPALRPGLAAVYGAVSGERLGVAGLDPIAGVEAASLARARIDAPRLSLTAPTWFDDIKIAAHVRAALAKPVRRPNMT